MQCPKSWAQCTIKIRFIIYHTIFVLFFCQCLFFVHTLFERLLVLLYISFDLFGFFSACKHKHLDAACLFIWFHDVAAAFHCVWRRFAILLYLSGGLTFSILVTHLLIQYVSNLCFKTLCHSFYMRGSCARSHSCSPRNLFTASASWCACVCLIRWPITFQKHLEEM